MPASAATLTSSSTRSSLRRCRPAASGRTAAGARRPAGSHGELGALAVAAGEPAAVERAPRDHAHAVALARRQHRRSIPRTKIEYGGCSHTNRSRPRRSATHCASTMSSAGNVDDPR